MVSAIEVAIKAAAMIHVALPRTVAALLADIDMDQYVTDRLPGRIVLNDLEDYVRREKPDSKSRAMPNDVNTPPNALVCSSTKP